VVVYFGAIGTLVSAVPMLFTWRPVGLPVLGVLAAAGGCATIGQYLLSRGYGCAPAAQIAPFTYVSVVFAALYGWLFWQELPGWTSAVGALLVAAAGVLAMRR
jgi:drug/metabolite transporter (DMT)-like permease